VIGPVSRTAGRSILLPLLMNHWPRSIPGTVSSTINREATTVVPADTPRIELAAEIPIDLASKVYARVGRVHIPGALAEPVAKSIFQRLSSGLAWRLVYSDASGEHKEIRADEYNAMSERAYVDLLNLTARQGRVGFQYIYRNYPLYDQFMTARERGDSYLMQLVEFLNSEPFLSAMRKVTGDDSIEFADANATLYEPGHFLTVHDDTKAGKNRVAAYVLNLTPAWRSDWGGMLTFHGPTGHILEGYIPTFNALNIFRVPQVHAVTYVSALAGAGRLSVTGWLHRGPRNSNG
jgi:SM-20-related protein